MFLKEEAMTLEYTVTTGEAAVVAQAESEFPIHHIELTSPSGERLLRMHSLRQDRDTRRAGVSGFVIESLEGPISALMESYPEGLYRLKGRTGRGLPTVGSAMLSHELLPAPMVAYPYPGAHDVSPTLVVSWIPDHSAAGYHVVLEQGDSDNLTVDLPAGTSSFRVPAGVLAPGTDSHVEVGAIAENGNRTLVEIAFRTR